MPLGWTRGSPESIDTWFAAEWLNRGRGRSGVGKGGGREEGQADTCCHHKLVWLTSSYCNRKIQGHTSWCLSAAAIEVNNVVDKREKKMELAWLTCQCDTQFA